MSLHIGLGRGDAANRIVLMGEEVRARLVATHLTDVREIRSNRGFCTLTGQHEGIPITIMSIGLGYPMMDLAVRELREIIDGPMYMVRLGTCGLIQEPPEGQECIRAVICDCGSAMIQRNYDCDYFSDQERREFYHVSQVWPADPVLTELIRRECASVKLWSAVNVTADSFYSSQGRPSAAGFLDHNELVVETVLNKVGKLAPCVTFEMETGHLFHLAKAYTGEGQLRAAAVQMIATRRAGPLTEEKAVGLLESTETRRDLELVLGKAIISALCKLQL